MLRREWTVSLDGTWEFAPDYSKCENVHAHVLAGPEIAWREIEVPYFWNGSRWMSVVGDYYYQNGYYKDGRVPPYKDHKGVGWYRKKFILPQAWRGRRVHLRFLAVSAKARVWINGHYVGEHLGAYSAFGYDLTDYVGYTAENTLVVQVWGKNCFYPADQRTYDQGGIHMFVPGRSLETAVGETRDNAGIGQPVELFATGMAYIEDLEATTGLDDLKLKIHIVRKYIEPGIVKVRARLYELETGRAVKEETRETCLPESSMIFTFVWNSLDVSAWRPESPGLYRLDARIEYQGEEWDAASLSIGFKTFGIRNGKFYLNGRAYFLRGAGPPPSPLIVHDREYIAGFLSMCKGLNLNCIRFHTEPPSQAWLDGCDEAGLLVIFEGPLMQQAPEIINTRQEYRKIVHQAKHHPCLAIYCLSNETEFLAEMGRMAGYESMAAYLQDLRQAVLEEDDSLPIYHDAGYSGETEDGDIRDWHIYGGWYENALFAFEAVLKGQAMMEALAPAEGSPMAPGGLIDRRNSKYRRDTHKPLILTEFLAAYTADDGHLLQYPLRVRRIGKYPDPGNQRSLWFQAFLLKEIVEILRRSRDEANNLSGISPFALFNWFFHPLEKDRISLKPAALALRGAMEPAHVSLKCWRRHLFSGDDLRVEAYLINDDVLRGPIPAGELRCRLLDTGGQVIAAGTEPADPVGYYEIKIQPVSLTVPDIGSGFADVQLEVVWAAGSEDLSTNSVSLLVAPAEYKKPLFMAGVKFHLFDPAGRTTALCKRMGLEFTPVSSFTTGPVMAGLRIVIGADSLTGLAPEDKAGLNACVKAGATVLVMEQDVYHPDKEEIAIDWLDSLPLSIIREGDQVDDFVHVSVWESPIFAGLQPEHFRLWNGNTVIISSYIRQGTEADHVPAATLFGARAGYKVNKLKQIKTYVECFNFLRNDGLVEVPLGKGRVIFNQLEASRRYGDDPVATVYLNNLMRYVLKGAESR